MKSPSTAFSDPGLPNNWFSKTPAYESAVCIGLINEDVFVLHRPDYVAALFKSSSTTVTRAYGIDLKHCFGITRKAAVTYFADGSGSLPRPLAGSNVAHPNRVGYLTHTSLHKGLPGPGLAPLLLRFQKTLAKSLDSANAGPEWVQFDDLVEFFEQYLRAAVIEAAFGSALLDYNLNFVSDIWAFDRVVIGLAKRIPFLLAPRAYLLRKKILTAIKQWHTLAQQQPKDNSGSDLDTFCDPPIMRSRYKLLAEYQAQDQDSIASTDFAFIWA